MKRAAGFGERLRQPPELGIAELGRQLDDVGATKRIGRPRNDCDEREAGQREPWMRHGD